MKLHQSCNISDCKSLLEKMYLRENFSTLNLKRQRNVIGCFLGGNLTRVRHASEIYERLKTALSQYKNHRKKYSPEEDRIILDEVAINGNTTSTWKALTKKLNRGENFSNIRRRHTWLLNSA